MNQELMDNIFYEVTSGLVEPRDVHLTATFIYQPCISLRDFWPIDDNEIGVGD